MKKVVIKGDRYELTLDSGKTIEVGQVTSRGKKNTKEPHLFDHEVRFSDGTVQKHVVSVETLILPDYPALQR